MSLKINFVIIAILIFIFTSSLGIAREYIIYSIAQDISMGEKNEKIIKNFYVNMGQQQGIQDGTILDVFRVISRLDPYSSKKRYNFKVKIGELRVLHAEEHSSITTLEKFEENINKPIMFEIKNFMIGDSINVHVSN